MSVRPMTAQDEEIVLAYCRAEVKEDEALSELKISYQGFRLWINQLGFTNSSHLYSSVFGYIARDSEFWLEKYSEYIKGKSHEDLAIGVGVTETTIRNQFKRMRLKSKSFSIAQQDSSSKRNATCEDKFGGHPFSNKSIIKKLKKTCVEKYGYSNPMQSDSIRAKQRKTMMSRHGVAFPAQSPKFKVFTSRLRHEKRLVTELQELGFHLLEDYVGLHSEEHKEGTWRKYKIKHDCGTEFIDDVYSWPKCPSCKGVGRSSLEDYYYRYLVSLGLEVIPNKKFGRKEIDLFLPSLNIGFEIDSRYHHSLFHKKGKTEKNYHQDKTKWAEDLGIKVFHIWDFKSKKKIKAKLNSILGITSSLYARKLKFTVLDSSVGTAFFNENHLSGNTKAFLYVGLVNDKEGIVSAMSFRKLGSDVELARFCSQLDLTVVGGFSKLLQNSIPLLKGYTRLITYADCDWSPVAEDTVYYKTGFELLGQTGPSLFYTNFNKVWSRQHFQKYKLKTLYPETYSDALTEQDILVLNKIYPLYNSGNWKFIKEINHA